jgi:hypothetical protein
MLHDVFLIAQPPLLGEEGKIRHTTIWATADAGSPYAIRAKKTTLTNL